MALEDYIGLEPYKKAGMSHLYKARNRQGEPVIIKNFKSPFYNKCLTQDDQNHLDYLERLFEAEAGLLKCFNHPRIPKYIDFFIETEKSKLGMYLVMEELRGDTLRNKLKVRRLTQDETINTSLQVLDVLEYTHSMCPPVIHNDIKPSNIFLQETEGLKLIDWGSADYSGSKTYGRIAKRIMEFGRSATRPYTPGFAPAELLRDQIQPQTDLYALGVTIVCMLKGREGMRIISDTYKGDKEIRVPFRNRHAFRADLTKELDASPKLIELIYAMTEFKPENRPVSAKNVRQVLESI